MNQNLKDNLLVYLEELKTEKEATSDWRKQLFLHSKISAVKILFTEFKNDVLSNLADHCQKEVQQSYIGGDSERMDIKPPKSAAGEAVTVTITKENHIRNEPLSY